MSQVLDPLSLPLQGSALIEASAGTGKTYTIATLYLRLLLGHGEPATPPRQPREILVMTFTRAATEELRERIALRLYEAMTALREGAPPASGDALLQRLLRDYPDPATRAAAIIRLENAFNSVDEASIHTIDAWCHRVLREHALATGHDPEAEILTDSAPLRIRAVQDFWRREIYALQCAASWWLQRTPDPETLLEQVAGLPWLDPPLPAPRASFHDWLEKAAAPLLNACTELKAQWSGTLRDTYGRWLQELAERDPYPLNRKSLPPEKLQGALQSLDQWCVEKDASIPTAMATLAKLGSALAECFKKGMHCPAPPSQAQFDTFLAALQQWQGDDELLHGQALAHAAAGMAALYGEEKQRLRQLEFNDLSRALWNGLRGPGGTALAEALRQRFPVILIDEFQDSSARQYAIFERIYRPSEPWPDSLMLLIGDPKQSIYRFRGADLDSYLRARADTAPRHYVLGTNYRSAEPLVGALNALYARADERCPGGAFDYRGEGDDPLPYQAVAAAGRSQRWQLGGQEGPAITYAQHPLALTKDEFLTHFAEWTAATIAQLLGDSTSGFVGADGGLRRVGAGDIAILLRDRKEAAIMLSALHRRGLPAAFLSEKQSVYHSPEAEELRLWLFALLHPEDEAALRCALALPLLGLTQHDLWRLDTDEGLWAQEVERLREYARIWAHSGILTTLHRRLHQQATAARILARPDGERRLGNLLHLGELLQQASQHLEGREALLEHLQREQDSEDNPADSHVLRLESDAHCIRIRTIHSAKGLQYPLVFLPFIAATRKDGNIPPWQVVTDDDHSTLSWQSPSAELMDRERLREDLRLLYVALTRAEYALWLGLAAGKTASTPLWWRSAVGRLLGADEGKTPDQCLETWKRHPACRVLAADAIPSAPAPRFAEPSEPRRTPPVYTARFERDWSIHSFSRLSQSLQTSVGPYPSPDRLDPGAEAAGQGWHTFPQGPGAGRFLHELLQWLWRDGRWPEDWREDFLHRCDERGYAPWGSVLVHWFAALRASPLGSLGTTFGELRGARTEMPFWFPSQHLPTNQLDALCRQYLLPGRERPILGNQNLHGLFHGFMDLVFAVDGRYYVLDYKSTRLGENDAAYGDAAIGEDVLEHRYELQAALYLLALHRHLRQRLGRQYRAEQHLGGAWLWYLRACATAGGGLLYLAADPQLLDALDSAVGRN
ncbi:exodeoxyribonuclease V subunit beta [Acidithiobacillus caldus]